MRPQHPAPLLKPTGPRSEARANRIFPVDLAPRYPANGNELDERAVDLADLADLAQNMGAQPLTQTHRIWRIWRIWRRIWERSRAVKSTGQTFERRLTAPTAPTAPAGGPIATAADTGQPQGEHKDPDQGTRYLI